MLKTGLIARFRLWRTLRAACIFAARGHVPEASRAWRLALEIFPGCLPAFTALAVYDAGERLSALELRCAVLETQLSEGREGDRRQADLLGPMEERLRTAEASAIVARADWQSSRRQVDLRMNRLSQETHNLHEHLVSSVRNAVDVVEARTARSETLNAQLQVMASQMDQALEHLTALKALSLAVGRQRQEIAALQNTVVSASAPTASLP